MIERVPTPITVYAEPYAGGASAALHLLAAGVVKSVLLNDADVRIYAVWHSVLTKPDEFIERIQTVDLTMETWRECMAVVAEPGNKPDLFQLGFATFFLNRTNRSGIVVGAGPIGGYDQSGKWLLGARFYRNTLADRVRWIGSKRRKIRASNLDGLSFLRECEKNEAGTFTFVDPPYIHAGSRLYYDGMTEKAHRKLAAHFHAKSRKHWAMTYDDCELVREMYGDLNIRDLRVQYSLQSRRSANEVLIRP